MTARGARQVRPATARRAYVLLSVMLVLLFAGVVTSVLVRDAALARREVRAQAERAQATCLAQSGVRRARAALARNEPYRGETWQLSAELLGGVAPASVEIRVEPVADEPQARLITATADFPSDSLSRARRTQQFKVTLPERGKLP